MLKIFHPILYLFFISSLFFVADVTLMYAETSEVKNENGIVNFIHFDNQLTTKNISVSDATWRIEENGDLSVKTGHHRYEHYKGRWPGIRISPSQEYWDLSQFDCVVTDIENRSEEPVTVSFMIHHPLSNRSQYRDRVILNEVMASVSIRGKERGELRIPLLRNPYADKKITFPFMRGTPNIGQFLDPSQIQGFEIYVNWPMHNHHFAILGIRGEGNTSIHKKQMDTKPNFYPMVDQYGQYVHKEWQGKVHQDKDLIQFPMQEEEDLSLHLEPKNRSKYGGWSNGPHFEGTGFFTLRKWRGSWWLQDPDGFLFWSHGINCVNSEWITSTIGREHFFANLSNVRNNQVNIFHQNLQVKYGRNWERVFQNLAHRRLRSWGINTIANWSDPAIYALKKTPYVKNIGGRGITISGSSFPDPFDPDFRIVRQKVMELERNSSAQDPWCIGYFSDNELRWGDGINLAVQTLKSPEDQPAKREFIRQLQNKYNSIDQLNEVWNSHYQSFQEVLLCQIPPDPEYARHDLIEFYTLLAEEYFSICEEEIKRVAPNHLYLGCRFSSVGKNKYVIQAAGKICDVLSFNIYDRRPDDLIFEFVSNEIDKPILITEFMFTAPDHGMFEGGLQRDRTQQERAASYEFYVRSALRNDRIIGTHYFQYLDQPLTGRGADGENYPLGFVDVCDSPYQEIIESSRRIGNDLYEYRLIDHRW